MEGGGGGKREKKGRSPFSLHQCYNYHTWRGGEEGKFLFSLHHVITLLEEEREEGRSPLAYTNVITLLEGEREEGKVLFSLHQGTYYNTLGGGGRGREDLYPTQANNEKVGLSICTKKSKEPTGIKLHSSHT